MRIPYRVFWYNMKLNFLAMLLKLSKFKFQTNNTQTNEEQKFILSYVFRSFEQTFNAIKNLKLRSPQHLWFMRMTFSLAPLTARFWHFASDENISIFFCWVVNFSSGEFKRSCIYCVPSVCVYIQHKAIHIYERIHVYFTI